MAGERIVQNAIRRLGQSQLDRPAAELKAHFVDVDERDPARLMAYAARLAPRIRYHDAQDAPAGDWSPFFRTPDGEEALAGSADVPPHLALFAAFLRAHEEARRVVNQLTGEHLRFFYQDVLGFQPRSAIPDRAHVLVELKNNVAEVRIGPEHLLSGGKGPEGERLYAPTGETILRPAKVASLRSIFFDGLSLHASPVADSPDGLGGEWETGEPQWSAFGNAEAPLASLGFALSSPVLRLAEGTRKITCLLRLENVDAAAAVRALPLLDAYLCGAEGWIGPITTTVTTEGEGLSLGVTLESTDAAVVDYQADLHGQAYTAEAPIIQFLLRFPNSGPALATLREAVVRGTSVRVEVTGATSLVLESDPGPLDPKRAFLPFGPIPVAGSRFIVSYPEALAKRLSQLKVKVRWLAPPSDFGARYANYGETVAASDFGAFVAFRDAAGTSPPDLLVPLFGTTKDGWVEFDLKAPAAPAAPAAPLPTKGRQLYALSRLDERWARQARRDVFRIPVDLKFRVGPVTAFLASHALDVVPGAITFALSRDFLHATYRYVLTYNALNSVKDALLEPYTPTIQAIELAYTASSAEVDVSANSIESFSSPEVQFFHVDAFGQRREHGYRRLKSLSTSEVPLLPEHAYEGELLVGLQGVEARDTVSLLVQVAESTADPDLAAPTVEWSALCDNDWQALRPEEVVADGSGGFRRSGIVSLVLPREATTTHTLLPDGLTWLRAAVQQNSRATCQLVALEANAIEVERTTSGTGEVIAASSIAKLKTAVAGVKAVTQPYPSFGGRAAESGPHLNTRAAERLRHRNRCVAPWDYERIVLEAFPQVHRVKCVPHARPGAWLSPGHVLLVVVPDLRARSAVVVDPAEPVPAELLQPRVDLDTLDAIGDHVRERCGFPVEVHPVNPSYQKVQLSFDVRFHPGKDFHYHRSLLERALIKFLSPWAYQGTSRLSFGGRVYRSVLLHFVEELSYVDFVTAFRLLTETAGEMVETAEAVPQRPDVILVSDQHHTIREVA